MVRIVLGDLDRDIIERTSVRSQDVVWENNIWRKLLLAVISISALQIDLTRRHRRRVSYIYCEGILRVLLRVGYIQIVLISMKNLLLSILHPRIAWDRVCRL